jgi:Prokaryotic homologs of the JAB domain
MTSEVCFLVGADGAVLWADRSGSPVALPDSRARWEAVWRHRDRLALIAHTHPSGAPGFSAEDESTMAAIDAALGRRLNYVVVTAGRMLLRQPDKPDQSVRDEPWWTALLRAASGM